MSEIFIVADREQKIEIEVTKTGAHVKWLCGDHAYLNRLLRQGSITFVIKPPKKKRTRKKPPAQNISNAGNIESEERSGEESVDNA